MSQMSSTEKQEVLCCIDHEGLDYTFQHYSNFPEIKNAEFHRLRQAYIDSAKALEEYLNR